MAAGGCWARMFGSNGWSGACLALCLVVGLGSAAAAGTADPSPSSVPDDVLNTGAAPDKGTLLSYDTASGSTVAPTAARPSDESRAQDQEGQRDLLLLLLMRNLGAHGPFGTFGR